MPDKSLARSLILIYTFHREKGGVDAERAERERWITRERQKIMDSVNGRFQWNFVVFCLQWATCFNELVPGNHSLKQTDLCLTSDYY